MYVISRALHQHYTLLILDCKPGVDGSEYRGPQTQTADGHTCQRWDTQTPHPHTYIQASMFPEFDTSTPANMCRNPAGPSKPEGPWCFTTSPDAQWGYCDVAVCGKL